MKQIESGPADARLALIASWSVAFVVLFQGVGSMLSQVTDELNRPLRAMGLVAALISAGLFLATQRLVVGLRPVPRWMLWVSLAAAAVAFSVGAWLSVTFALGVLILTLPPRRALVLIGLVGVLMEAFLLRQGLFPLSCLFYLAVTAAIALLLYVLTRLAVIVQELMSARETMARMKVDEERHRISRDLHDILGRTLVAVSLRVQTALRLLDRAPAQCEEQLEETARLVSDGQSQLRALTRGEQVLGFHEEIESATSLFDRLGIQWDVDLPDHPEVGPALDTLGARILRECVTNLLKHSRPTQVQISLREESSTSVLVVANDGASSALESRGTGLADLADRVAAVGGSLEAGHASRGRFRVLARLPRTDGAGAPAGPAKTGAHR